VRQIVLRNDRLSLSVLPELGGKLGSLIALQDGREHLLQPPEHARRRAEYGGAFDQYDTSGFDECFPTVAECSLDDGTRLPDHGELWSVEWQVLAQSATSLSLQATGQAFPYAFRRRVTLDDSQVILEYEVVNQGEHVFAYLWSAHPLLSVGPGDRVNLPSGVASVQVESSAGERLSGEVPWNDRIALLGPVDRGWADKLFAGPLEEGWCRVVYSDGASLTYRFSPEELPYVGLWICQGGWPGRGRKPHYTVALEPCTAACDALHEALKRGQAKSLQPGQRAAWRMTMDVRPAQAAGHASIGTEAGV
jgi:galactose mutarotase-like enzyme